MRNIKLLLGILLSALVLNNAIATNDEDSVLSKDDIHRFTKILSEVKKYYYKPVEGDLLFDKAIRGMLFGLDPHSSYMDADDLKDLEMTALGKFGGIGVEVYPDQGAIKVVSPIDDTPAYRAGIKAGDYIVQINNKLVRDMTLRDAVRMMRGPKGSRLSLTIIRKNKDKPLVFNLRREIIKIKTIKNKILEPGYGYVRLALFQESTEKDMLNAIKILQKSTKGNLKGLILDLRNNPGGLFESAVQVADVFLDADALKNNELIVSIKGQGQEVQVKANKKSGSSKSMLTNIPLVILINEGSASASEIVAGALQDHKRAIVVGERSFGKGSVQTVIPFGKDSAIKLTTALYYTPAGRSIQAKGIEPDINIENIKISRDNQDVNDIPRVDEAALVDHIQNGTNESKYASDQQKQSKTANELAYKDYQLYEALHILKGQNVIAIR